jgi:hypothetical protein
VLPANRQWTVTFLAALPEGPVTVNGTPAEVTGVDGRWSVTASAVTAGTAGTAATAGETVVRIAVGPLRVGSDRRDAARAVLESAQAANPEKLEAWGIVSSERSAAEKLAELSAVDLPEPVRAALFEQLAAVHPAG